MAEFVTLARWLRDPTPEAVTETIVIEEPPAVVESSSAVVDASVPEDELIDDVCARVRRFRAMLAEALEYVQSCGEPAVPLRIHVHPAQLAKAAAIGLALAADAQLAEEEAIIELHCGSIDARLHVPLERLLVEKPQR
jgi:hypothetical protein